MRSLLNNQNFVFVHAPGVYSPEWPTEVKKRFYRDMDQSTAWKDKDPEQDWFYLQLDGTTFSGHSTKTTLGNTIRTLLYAWYYQMCTGLEAPWDNKSVFTIASGDDCVIFVAPQYSDALMATIKRLTTRDTDVQNVGLG